jgi:predicted O-methyltransferase YrrM
MKSFFDFILNFKRDNSSVDVNHCMLIYALAISHKPENILEIGVGSGFVTKTLHYATQYNGKGNITCVDNFHDWKGSKPNIIEEIDRDVTFVKSDEKSFVANHQEPIWDFIVLDADHNHSHEWAEFSYNMGRPNSIFIIHDIHYAPNLLKYWEVAIKNRFPNFIFDKSSRSDEGCEVGLLVVRKDCMDL